MNILPKAPLRLHPTVVGGVIVRATGLLAIAGAFVLGGIVWEGAHAADLWRESSVWSTGKEALAGSVSGKQYTRRIFSNRYSLEVRYQDEDEAWHNVHVEFSTLGARANTDVDPVIKYDPKNTQSVALSWGREVTGSRWGSVLLGFGIFFGVAGFLVHLARTRLRVLADLRTCAQAFTEIEIQIVGLEPILDARGRATGRSMCTFRLVGQPKTEKTEVPLHLSPLFLDKGETRVLALRSRINPQIVVIVEKDLKPFRFDERDRYIIKRRLESYASPMKG
jgi:hypothetical protein